MRIQCMAWPTRKDRCHNPAIEVGHGLYLCLKCQQTAITDLLRQEKNREDTEKELKKLAQRQAGQKPVRQPILTYRGEVLAGRFEENREKH
jgi:hypothetical protein